MPRLAAQILPAAARHRWLVRCVGLGSVLMATIFSALGDPTPDSLELTLPAKLLRLNRAIHSSDAEGLLVQVLAQISDLTDDGTPAETAIDRILGDAQPKDWLRDCLRSNWAAAVANRVISPKNLERMRGREMPLILFGRYEGKELMVLTEPDRNSPPEVGSITYRLLPKPLFEELEKQFAVASRQVPGVRGFGPPAYLPNSISPDWITPNQMPRNGFIPQSQSGDRMSPTAEYVLPSTRTPANQRMPPYWKDPLTFDVRVGQAPKLPASIGNRARVYVTSVDKETGIKFFVVDEDTDQMDKFLSPLADTKYYLAKWVAEPIPGTLKKGTFLIAFGNVRYYLSSFDPGKNQIRLVICNFPMPEGFDPPPEPKPDPDNGK